MSQIKRPRGRPITRVLPMPGTAEYTEGCPGCRRDGCYHNAQCKRRTADRQQLNLTGEVQHLVWEVLFQYKQQVALPLEQEARLMWEVAIKFKLRLTRESRPRKGRQQFTWELRTKKHSRKQLIKTWPMLRRTKTWLTWQSCNTHILTKMRNGNTLTRGISMKMTERLWILCRSEGSDSFAVWRFAFFLSLLIAVCNSSVVISGILVVSSVLMLCTSVLLLFSSSPNSCSDSSFSLSS